ncbi:hypothetical protein PAECIP111893_05309 [Paenibacillus plantiphilus]|uniref:Knr4/Smi1-like domain-containing protein n=1 Tax=Paenibacillus plantiphilus TaxID=2905650 RepID=A0ABN8H7A8_9BACL|nr:SMI1/KNR4 family protein [Paenibacillus plantiphilus]CAH1225980.1 hypothetical protein PAECIP111893_05309 [Paenibacillus plantiphilus]
MTMTNDSFNQIEKYLIELGISSGADSYSEEELIRLEEKYEIDFLEIYKIFVLKYGNSTFENDVRYRPLNQSHWTGKDGLNAFGSFFGFEEGVNNLEENIKRYYDRVPNSIVPIADDGVGNLISIGIKGDHIGKIYFWDHENEITAKIMLNEKVYVGVSVDDYWENIFLIAESFFDFIKSFEIEEVVSEESDIESKIVSEKMSGNFMAMMLAAKAELEAKEKTRKEKKKDK